MGIFDAMFIYLIFIFFSQVLTTLVLNLDNLLDSNIVISVKQDMTSQVSVFAQKIINMK